MNVKSNVRVDSILGVRRYARRLSLTKLFARRVDAGITRVQEWLEGEDEFPTKTIGYGILILTGIFLVGQLMRWVYG